jgi:hypothetical protein
VIERKGNIPNLPFEQIVGRDPVGKTVTVMMAEAHPDWTDEQIATRINQEYTHPVITVEEVAQWRPAVAR